MQINLLKIIFCTLILVEILASDVALELDIYDNLVGELDSLLNTNEQSKENDEILFSVNDETLEKENNVVPNNQQSIPISNFAEPPLLHASNSQNRNDSFLSGISTERIVDYLVGPDQRHSSGNFFQSFLLCGYPNPWSHNCGLNGWKVREVVGAFLCACVLLFLFFFILLGTCGQCLGIKVVYQR
jgi:hypothetical protein